MKVRDITFIGVAAAIICIFAPMSVQIGPIPITLATFAIYFTAATLGAYRGTIAVSIYILLGMIGLPVFSNYTGGLQKIAGATGGYIIGYIPLALIIGLFADKIQIAYKKEDGKWNPRSVLAVAKYPVGMLLGTAVLYVFGTAWYCFVSGNTLAVALTYCVIPFLGVDLIKIVAASALTTAIVPALRRIPGYYRNSVK